MPALARVVVAGDLHDRVELREHALDGDAGDVRSDVHVRDAVRVRHCGAQRLRELEDGQQVVGGEQFAEGVHADAQLSGVVAVAWRERVDLRLDRRREGLEVAADGGRRHVRVAGAGRGDGAPRRGAVADDAPVAASAVGRPDAGVALAGAVRRDEQAAPVDCWVVAEQSPTPGVAGVVVCRLEDEEHAAVALEVRERVGERLGVVHPAPLVGNV